MTHRLPRIMNQTLIVDITKVYSDIWVILIYYKTMQLETSVEIVIK